MKSDIDCPINSVNFSSLHVQCIIIGSKLKVGGGGGMVEGDKPTKSSCRHFECLYYVHFCQKGGRGSPRHELSQLRRSAVYKFFLPEICCGIRYIYLHIEIQIQHVIYIHVFHGLHHFLLLIKLLICIKQKPYKVL